MLVKYVTQYQIVRFENTSVLRECYWYSDHSVCKKGRVTVYHG